MSKERYKAYPKYKDSGEEWLGSIPSTWQVSRHKYIATFSKGKNPSQLIDSPTSGALPYLSMDFLRGMDEAKYAMPQGAAYVAEDGQVLVIWDGSNAGEFIKGKNGILSSTMAAAEITNDMLPQYYWYACVCLEPEMRRHATGMGIPHVNGNELKSSLIPTPSLPEQTQITKFLDHETAKIDRLIEKQEELIRLLKEKRQAVISHAVTKGLNPHAPLKDSGIPWLGPVPAHWEVKSLRYLGRCQNGLSIGGEAFGSGYPFISYGDVCKNRILPETGSGLVQSAKDDRLTYSVEAGDVFFTRTSETIEEIGFSSTCLKTIENATFAGFLIRFRPDSDVLESDFAKHYFSGSFLRAFFVKEMNLITRASLSQDLLKQLAVALPPRKEQKAIANFLDNKVAIFSRLTEQAESVITLLQERRTALISTAVTGKIDVRNTKI